MLSGKKNQLTLLYRVLSLCCFICLRNMIQSPWCSLVLLLTYYSLGLNILFSSYFVCYYLQSIELKLFKPTLTNRFPFFHLTWTVTYIVSLPLYWELGDDKRWNLWEHLTFYYIHFEITGYPCNLIGSQQCDLFLNRTIFCSKSHLFQIASFMF